MPKTNNYQQRAEEFLKLWQAQMTKQMTNPDIIRVMLAAMQSFGVPPHDANARRPTHAPDARDDAIRDLTKRVDTLERELAKLHARMDAAKNPARASERPHAKPVAATKRAVAGKRSKPVAKRKQK